MSPSSSFLPSGSALRVNFEESARLNGYVTRPASEDERKEDIDFVIWRLEDNKPVDISAVSLKKTILRQSKKKKELWGWVEFHDRYGKPGWLFKKSTLLAFQRKNDFILLAKTDFHRWIGSGVIKWGTLAPTSWAARYRIFRRKGTRELISQFKLSHALSKCRHYKWKLHGGNS